MRRIPASANRLVSSVPGIVFLYFGGENAFPVHTSRNSIALRGIFLRDILSPRKTPHIHVRRPPGLREGGVDSFVEKIKTGAGAEPGPGPGRINYQQMSDLYATQKRRR
jgi:hypothetical protein